VAMLRTTPYILYILRVVGTDYRHILNV
jgi:hypothetical protein